MRRISLFCSLSDIDLLLLEVGVAPAQLLPAGAEPRAASSVGRWITPEGLSAIAPARPGTAGVRTPSRPGTTGGATDADARTGLEAEALRPVGAGLPSPGR